MDYVLIILITTIYIIVQLSSRFSVLIKLKSRHQFLYFQHTFFCHRLSLIEIPSIIVTLNCPPPLLAVSQ